MHFKIVLKYSECTSEHQKKNRIHNVNYELVETVYMQVNELLLYPFTS